MNSLLSREQITAIKDHFAAVEITDAGMDPGQVEWCDATSCHGVDRQHAQAMSSMCM
jgi:hypothetical protein